MAEERVQRRLAAILAADVVGFSRLMGEDETGTLNALNLHRAELVHPTVAEHRGRIVKLMGDGALVEFASVVDAVECAANLMPRWVFAGAFFLTTQLIRNVRFGSGTDIDRSEFYVRFTPNNGHKTRKSRHR